MPSDESHEDPQSKTTDRTTIFFEPGTPLPTTTNIIRSLSLPLPPDIRFSLEYALTEALSNSLRASAEQRVADPVVLVIQTDPDMVRVKVEDAAGGFDLKGLPYDFDSDPDGVDVASDDFDRYRASFDQRRFGLGLLTMRGVVDEFSIVFIDASGNEAPWGGRGSVHGTRVRFGIRRPSGKDERRSSDRRAVKGGATAAGGMKAHVCDLSLTGVRLAIICKQAPEPDDAYRLHINMQDGGTPDVEVEAKVVRTRRMGVCYDVGAEFVDLKPAAIAKLKRMIEQIDAASQPGALRKIQVGVHPGGANPL